MPSFDAARQIDISTKNTTHSLLTNVPYDPKLSFDRLNENKNNKSDVPNYSIDIGKILREIHTADNSGNWDRLSKVTFAGRPVGQNVGLWDIFFGASHNRATTACVMVAQSDCSPIPSSRITSSFQFVNTGRPVIRTHLNQLIPGDVIAIAISAPNTGFTYILLYRLDEACMVRPATSDGTINSTLVPAANVTLEYVFQIDHTDNKNAGYLNITEKEYDPSVSGGLVAALHDAVTDIGNAYPWKPHFVPEAKIISRSKLEKRLMEKIPTAQPVSFDNFMETCHTVHKAHQTAYEEARNLANQESKDKPQQGRKKKNHTELALKYVPQIEVVSVGTKRYVSFGDNRNNGDMIVFDVEEMGYHFQTEIYLTNQDLEKRSDAFLADAIALSESFGDKAILRYFTVSF